MSSADRWVDQDGHPVFPLTSGKGEAWKRPLWVPARVQTRAACSAFITRVSLHLVPQQELAIEVIDED